MTIFRNGNHDVALIPFAQAILFIFIRVSLPPPPLSHRFWDFPFFFHFFAVILSYSIYLDDNNGEKTFDIIQQFDGSGLDPLLIIFIFCNSFKLSVVRE
jgi:hypothetical protein